MKISPHFQLEEFASWGRLPTGAVRDNVVDLAVRYLEPLRAVWGVSAHINSGWRKEDHNDYVGGEENSYHLTGQAADVVFHGIAPEVVWCTALKMQAAGQLPPGGLGVGDTFVHIDSGPARTWHYGQGYPDCGELILPTIPHLGAKPKRPKKEDDMRDLEARHRVAKLRADMKLVNDYQNDALIKLGKGLKANAASDAQRDVVDRFLADIAQAQQRAIEALQAADDDEE